MNKELRARARFAEGAITNALTDLRDPIVRRSLGETSAAGFEQLLSRAAIAQVADGELFLPADYDYENEPVPIVAIHQEESVKLPQYFETQTKRQKQKTLEVWQSWEPDTDISALYDEFFASDPDDESRLSVNNWTPAQVNYTQRYLISDELPENFARPPRKGLIAHIARPLLFVMMNSEIPFIRGDVMIHESVHIQQIESRPVEVFRSQLMVDLRRLEMELEAYRPGALVANKYQPKIGQNPLEKLLDQHCELQLQVEQMRAKTLGDLVSCTPTVAMLQHVKESNLRNIIAGNIDYEEVMSEIQADIRRDKLAKVSSGDLPAQN